MTPALALCLVGIILIAGSELQPAGTNRRAVGNLVGAITLMVGLIFAVGELGGW